MRRLVLLGRWEVDANFLVPCTEFVPVFLGNQHRAHIHFQQIR